MSFQAIIEKIKELSLKSGTQNQTPANGSEAICIKEQKLGSKYSASVAIGKVVSFNTRYFEVQGFVFEDTFNRWSEGNIRIEPKVFQTTKGLSYNCIIFKEGLIRKFDERRWDNKMNSLQDLVEILQ